MGEASASRHRGRPAAASRTDVLAAATARFHAGQRIDLQAIAAELGLGRATVYRWFGSRLLTSSAGPVQPRAVDAIAGLIEAEARAGTYALAIEPRTLAYAIVRLYEAFVYNDAAVGIRGDIDRLREVEAALLGLGPAAPVR